MIKIDNLKRAYGDFMAVDDVSFSIEMRMLKEVFRS